MKKLLIILFLFIGSNVYSQTFTQTFIDRCTGEVKIVTANFVNGSATVAFYNRVRIFTYAEFTSGVLQQWLNETYEWWNTLSPCSTTTQQVQQAQQTAQAAQQAAQTAQSAASSASAAASSAATAATAASTPPTTNTMTGGTNASSNTTNSSTSQNTSTNSSNESGSSNTSGSTKSSSSESSGGSSEGKSEGGGGTSEEGKSSESKGEETETKSEESSEEAKSEESSDEGDGEEGGDEKEDSDDNGDGEESEEEEVNEEKKKRELLPIQLRADMMGNQNLMGGYDAVISIGATQSSIFGDETYGATAMIYSNLKQVALNASYTKVHMEKLNLSTLHHNEHTHYSKTSKVTSMDPIEIPTPKLKSITSASLGYMNNFGNGTIVVSAMEIKPMGKWGTAGVGVNVVNMFGEGKYQMTMLGYNMLYTNMVNLSQRVQYTPALIWTQSPYMGKIGFTKNKFGKDDKFAPNQLAGTRIDGMVILSNSFNVQLTRRFSFNIGATFIKSTNPTIPLVKSFMIGSKLPF